MQRIAPDVVRRLVQRLVHVSMTMNPAKTAKLIEILFGVSTRVGPRNCVLDGARSATGR